VGGASDRAQDESNERCLQAVKEGKIVVRFKTGDPFVFGRGAEEILFFRKYDIEPIVVPGLSSVFAAPELYGIPVTHRGSSDQVLLLSGRGVGGSFPTIPEFDSMRTTIILMSLSRLSDLKDLMASKGYPLELPCAVIEKGCWRNGSKISRASLRDIPSQVKIDGIENPAMFIAGYTVNLSAHSDLKKD
jgi:uroporphyrin-III C-methyltransferase